MPNQEGSATPMTRQASSEVDAAQHDGAPGALRLLALTAVGVGIAALAAATFVLSYTDIRTIVSHAGIQPSYAKVYPLLIDAMLVIALAAVLALRGAGVLSRILAWLTLLVVLGAAAGADTLRSTGWTIPYNVAAGIVAVLPWALIFVAFVLLLAMLRHARRRRQAGQSRSRAALASAEPMAPEPSGAVPASSLPISTPEPWESASIVPRFSSLLAASAAAGAAAGAAAAEAEPWFQARTAEPEPVTQAAADDAGDATGTPDDEIGPAQAESDPTGLAGEPAVPADEAAPQTDETAPQTE